MGMIINDNYYLWNLEHHETFKGDFQYILHRQDQIPSTHKIVLTIYFPHCLAV